MSALDKLNAKAREHIEKKERSKNVEFEKVEDNPADRHAEKENEPTESFLASKERNTKKVMQTKKGKHAGGRPNTRGRFKMVNIAVPEEVYDRLKEVCNGNMTYYLNDIIRKNIKM